MIGWQACLAFGELVVKLDLAVHEAGFGANPLAGGIGERLAELAPRRNPAKAGHPTDQLGKVIVRRSGFEPAGALPVERSGPLFTQAGLDPIDAYLSILNEGGEPQRKRPRTHSEIFNGAA
jgi:hypothetical protein